MQHSVNCSLAAALRAPDSQCQNMNPLLIALHTMQVQTMDYSCIVFDTAPTGHTLRLLQFPTTLQKGLSKLMSLKGMFGGMLNQLGSLFGAGGGDNMQDQLLGKLEQLKVSMFADCRMHACTVRKVHFLAQQQYGSYRTCC